MQKNILVVDDNPEVLRSIVQILEKNEDYNILQTLTVDFAFKIASTRNIDLVISDWQMPEQSGLDLIKLFAKHESTRGIPIVIITGVLTEVTNLEMAFEIGAIDFMRKPIEEIELVSRVKSILRLKQYQQEIIEQKNKELALHAMYLLENKEKQIQLFKNLQIIITKLKEGKKQVLNFIESITLGMKSDLQRDTWKDFELYFNQTHPDFTKRLAERFPNITPADIRLCIFLRMNMDSQGISDALHISTDSVKTARTRLRAKLNLDRQVNLVTFIASI